MFCVILVMRYVVFNQFFQMYRAAAPPVFMPAGQSVGNHSVRGAQMLYPGVPFIIA